MFVLLLAVPAFLVVLLGYVVGHRVWTWLGGALDGVLGTSLEGGAEVVGWLTGGATLAATVGWTVRRRRARRRRRT